MPSVRSESPSPTIAFLRDLVAINSVNPSLVLGAPGEWDIGQRIAAELQRHGIDVHTFEVAPRRANVVGTVDTGRPGRTLMLCGHLDTVGVKGMTDPFTPVERGGRLYGRGAQDMKSGVAAMVGAAIELADSGGLPAGRLVVAAVVDEEHSSLGADALVGDWRADGAVVTEPTGLAVGTAHKGFAWVDVETHGRAAHGSRPGDGRDAILRMGRVLAGLEGIDRALQARTPHALLGTPSLHASMIGGGSELSVYPDHCTLSLERRTVIDEPDGVALTEVNELLDTLSKADPEFDATAELMFERCPYEIPEDHVLVKSLGMVLADHGLPTEPTGMSFWTDAATLDQAGIPSVLFGPRGAGLHGVEEYVELDSVLTCQQVIVDLARAFCAGGLVEAGFTFALCNTLHRRKRTHAS